MPTKKGQVATEIYTEADKIKALTELALHNGRRKYASEATGIPENTISNWAYGTKRAEYQKIRREMKTNLREQEIEKHLAVAANARSLADEMLDRTREVLREGKIEPRDLPGSARNISTVAGIHTTKATELAEGVSDQTTTGRSAADIVRALKNKGVDLTKLKLTQTVEVTTEAPSEATGAQDAASVRAEAEPLAPESAIEGSGEEIPTEAARDGESE